MDAITSLDDVNLGDIQNPQDINPTTLSTTGSPPATQGDIIPVTNPPAGDKGDNDEPPVTDPPANTATPPVTEPLLIKTFEDLVGLVGTKETKDLSTEENDALSDIVSVFGGNGFNKDGAIVDAEGKVLYTADQIKEYITTDELPVDTEGNFINADGDIVKTKSELFREQTTVGTLMNSLAKNFNVSFSDTFQPADTEDAIIDLVSKVAEVIQNRSVETYIKANPELEAFRKHLLIHGSSKGYDSTLVDYDKIDIKILSKDAKQIYITEAYKASGRELTPAFTKYLNGLEEEDYNAEVSANLSVLKKEQERKQAEIEETLATREANNLKEAKDYWDSVTTTIKNGKLNDINIPLPEREGFLDYVTKVVQDGKTKDMLDTEKDDVTSDLLMSYFRYKNKDFSALARNIATTQKVEGLRERMAKNKLRIGNSDKGQKPRTQDNYIPSLGEVLNK